MLPNNDNDHQSTLKRMEIIDLTDVYLILLHHQTSINTLSKESNISFIGTQLNTHFNTSYLPKDWSGCDKKE